MKALASLTKGTMPAEHKPETSIQITNNITNTVEVGSIEVNGASAPADVAKAVKSEISAMFKKTAAQTPSSIVR